MTNLNRNPDHWFRRITAFKAEGERILAQLPQREMLREKKATAMKKSGRKPVIFLGHGRSNEWRKLKDFLVDTLELSYEEYNREETAGMSRKERLSSMLANADFALVIMTAEDLQEDGSLRARENVVHEVGLFQGKLGFERAIVMLEDGCNEFSNIAGLDQIRFPKGDIIARSENIRRVLKREGFLG